MTIPQVVPKETIIIKHFPREELNRIGNAIVKAAHKGSRQASNSGASWSNETRNFIYADKITELKTLMESWSPGGQGVPAVAKNDIVSAEWFNALSKALSNMQLSKSACDSCNTSCDSCISCQHSSCHGSS